jgi:tetratricopeptide (TPR) repeat protein
MRSHTNIMQAQICTWLAGFVGSGAGVHARIWLACGNLLVVLKQYGASVWCYRRAARVEPDSEYIQLRLAWFLWKAGKIQEADLAFVRLRDSTSSAWTLFSLAEFLQDQGRHTEAVAALDRAISCADAERDYRLHYARGKSLVALDQLDEGIAAFRHAVALKGDFADAVAMIGAAMAWTNRWEDAEKWNREAIRLHPNAATAYYLGLALEHLKRPVEAEAAFRQATELEPHSTEITIESYAHLALNIGNQGRREESIEHAARLVESAPADVTARNTLHAILLADGQHDRALTLARDTVALHPSDERPHIMLGWAYLAAEAPDQALAAFERARTLAIDPPHVHAGVGAALCALGRHQEAVEAFEQALARDPEFFEGGAMGAEYFEESQSQLRGDAAQ